MLEMGQRIAELRKSSGLKQQAIADACGVELRTYQFWQQGKHPPTGDALEKLSALFGVTPRFILRGDDAPTPDLSSRRQQADRIEEMLSDIHERVARLEDAAILRELAEIRRDLAELRQRHAEALERSMTLEQARDLLSSIEQLRSLTGRDQSRRDLQVRRAKGRLAKLAEGAPRDVPKRLAPPRKATDSQ